MMIILYVLILEWLVILAVQEVDYNGVGIDHHHHHHYYFHYYHYCVVVNLFHTYGNKYDHEQQSLQCWQQYSYLVICQVLIVQLIKRSHLLQRLQRVQRSLLQLILQIVQRSHRVLFQVQYQVICHRFHLSTLPSDLPSAYPSDFSSTSPSTLPSDLPSAQPTQHLTK